MKWPLLLMLSICCVPAFGENAVTREIKRYVHDGKAMALAPVHWTNGQWERFGEGVAAVAALSAADRPLYDRVQNARSPATNHFAKAVTPFGGRRAQYVSTALILGGISAHDTNVRDAGRDSLEAELI